MGEPQPIATGSGGPGGSCLPNCPGVWSCVVLQGPSQSSHSLLAHPWRVAGGLRRDGTFMGTYSELHAFCSYLILTSRPDIDAIMTLVSLFWKPRLREIKQLGATWLITDNV